MLRNRTGAAVLVATAMLAAACGGGDDGDGTTEAGGSPSTSEPAAASLATVAATADLVEVAAGGDTESAEAVTEPRDVAAGDVVHTDADGRAEIAWFDGSTARIGNDASFSVVSLSDDEGDRQVVGSLESGSSWHRVAELTGDDGTYSVQTPVATATATGTAFAVSCPLATLCTFSVIDGSIVVELPDGSTFDLVPGEDLVVDEGAGEPQVLDSGVEALATDPWIAENLVADGDDLVPAGDPGADGGPAGGEAVRAIFGSGRVDTASPIPGEIAGGLVAPGIVPVTEEVPAKVNADVILSAMVDCTADCVISDVFSFYYPGTRGERISDTDSASHIGFGFGQDGEVEPEPLAGVRVDFDLPAPATVDGDTTTGALEGTMTCAGASVGFSLAFELVEPAGDPDSVAFSGSITFDDEVHRSGDVACWTPSLTWVQGPPLEVVGGA